MGLGKIPRLIVHGGAWSIPDELDELHLSGIEKALEIGRDMLEDGHPALDVVEVVINSLEDDSTFDAGKGSFLNDNGQVEMDAIIVDGEREIFGAVGAIQKVRNPISVARKVLDHSDHHFLVGEGALKFAQLNGNIACSDEDLLVGRELSYYQILKKDPTFKPHHPFEFPGDTVGAVALDVHGHLACGTSTGGTPRKLAGRVGDAPIFGAGAYARKKYGAASSTGWGESIMRALLSKTVVDSLSYTSGNKAVINGLQYLRESFEGWAGIIGITHSGQYFHGHNTLKMAYGYLDDTSNVVVYIKDQNSE